ncbi:MAG: hypothetical protein V3U92_18270 [Cellulophaga sp.]
MKKYTKIILISFLLMNGCSKESGEKQQPESKQVKIFNSQVQALEKAKDVGQMLQNSADKQRQKIEEQTRSE